MAITSISIESLGEFTWLVSWTADGSGPFYLWVNGTLAEVTYATSALIPAQDGDSVLVDVLDTTAQPADTFPSRLTLGWYAVAGAQRYRIEEYVGAAWTARAKVRDDGLGYFTWRSRVLEDGETHQFRIIPEGNVDGTAVSFSALMVRHPDAPDPSYSYAEGTRQVTVS